MAHRAETTVAEGPLTSCVWTRFRIGSYSMPAQRAQSAHTDFARSKMYACLGVSRHLHFWQNDRGLVRATAITQGWNGHRISQLTKLTLERGGDVAQLVRASDRHAVDAGSISQCGKGFFPQSHLAVQTLLRCPYTPVRSCMHLHLCAR